VCVYITFEKVKKKNEKKLRFTRNRI